MVFENLVGKRYGNLTVTKLVEKNGSMKTLWECVCDCGKTVIRRSGYLRNKRIISKSCGCKSHIHKVTHGKTNIRLYYVWQTMKLRCYCKTSKSYSDYGNRGITVCDEWKDDFDAFYKWALANGYDENAEYSKCTIDRIDNNKGYYPENCRWVDMAVQSSNRRSNIIIEYNGEVGNAVYWANKTGLKATTIRSRYKKNMPIAMVFYQGSIHEDFYRKKKKGE